MHIVKKPKIRPQTHRGNQTLWMRTGCGPNPDPPPDCASGFANPDTPPLVPPSGFAPQPDPPLSWINLNFAIQYHESGLFFMIMQLLRKLLVRTHTVDLCIFANLDKILQKVGYITR